MPVPDNRPSPARPPSRGPFVPLLIAALVLVAVAVALVFFLRRPKNPPATQGAPAAESAAPAPTAAVSEPAATPTDSRYHPPRVLATRPVTYPELAFLNRAEGVVLVKFFVDETGKVSKPPIVTRSSGSVMLDAVVLERNLQLWTFQPATLDGKPVPGTVEKEFEFRLDPAGQRAMAEKRLAAKIGTPDAPYPKEALATKPQGTCTIVVTWTKGGLVDYIRLEKSSGSNLLDRVALRFAYENWRVDPKDVEEGKEFTREMTFTPPAGPGDTPPPLATAAPAPATTPTP